MTEAILAPDLPIIDPHHHLWDLRPLVPMFPSPQHEFIKTIAGAPYYTFDQLHADAQSGHRIIATVFMECGAFYRSNGDDHLKPVGEVEFATGVAAQGASGLYGEFRPCAGIVGHADLTRGAAAGEVLDALTAAGRGRFRGIRHQGAWDADPATLGPPFHAPQNLYAKAGFRDGFAQLGKRDLSFDAWVLEPQLQDVIDLARAFPDQPIILDHCGTPLNIAGYAGTLTETFSRWKASIETLSQCENVCVKLGGLGMPFCKMPDDGPTSGINSADLAVMWKPYIETCIEAFGPSRAMFESNYPVDRWGASYAAIWNIFKRLTQTYSDSEKRTLFAGTAARVYGIETLLPASVS